MRMDEYQQWLAAQFFDEEEPAAPAAESLAVVHEVVQQQPAEPVVQAAANVVASSEQQFADTPQVAEAAPAAELQEVEQSASQPAFVLPPPHTSPPSVLSSVTSRGWEDDEDVPAIENYLPF